MNLDARFNVDPASISLEKKRLKDLVLFYINTITEDQAKRLLKDIRVLEQFLSVQDNLKQETHAGLKPSVYRTAYNREKADRFRKEKKNEEILSKNYYRDGLKQVIGGMINTAPREKVMELTRNPNEFISILTGKSTTQTEENIAQLPEQKTSTIEEIKLFATENWMNLFSNKPEVLNHIYDCFEKAGLNIKAEFYDPYAEKYAKDFIIIAENKLENSKGIVVPRYGLLVNAAPAGLFKGVSRARGQKFSSMNLNDFPEVELVFDKKYYWKIIKPGEVGVPAGV